LKKLAVENVIHIVHWHLYLPSASVDIHGHKLAIYFEVKLSVINLRDKCEVIKSRRMRWTVHVACMGEMRNAYKILVKKPEGRRPFRRPAHRWEDNIIMNIRVGKVWTGCI
jgi:hypothetical protein